MVLLIDSLKQDLKTKTPYGFFIEHLAKTRCWYFSEYLNLSESEMLKALDDIKEIISKAFKINFNSIQLVGSAKIGFSLKPKEGCCLQPFRQDGNDMSDIDIAIVSTELFYFWKHFVKSHESNVDITERAFFVGIMNSMPFGYIDASNIVSIRAFRKEWVCPQNKVKKKVSDDLNVMHELTYRIYKDWESLERYQIRSIKNSQELILAE